MSAPALSFFILLIIAIAIFFVWLIYSRRYQRASQETAFVRTGYGGQKVVMNGGALVFPVLHEVIPVNMNTLRLEVVRAHNNALITKDRMRMDVQAEFYVRVKPTPEDIAMAAQTLGRRTTNLESLKNLVEGKFVNALREVAAEMNMNELHQNRGEFVRQVQAAVGDGLSKNGLELESVSLSELDQTDRKYFNPQNAFDAEGLMLLTELIQARAKQRNAIERDTEVAIRQKDLQAERQKLELAKEEEFARLEQELEIQVRRADQKTTIIAEQVEKERLAQEAELEARKKYEKSQIIADRELEEDRITNTQSVRERELAKSKSLEITEANQEREIKQIQIETEQFIETARIQLEKMIAEERLRKETEVANHEIERDKSISEQKLIRDRYLKEKEIATQRSLEAAEIEKRRQVKEADIQSRYELEKLQVQTDRELEEEKISKEEAVQSKELLRRKAVEEIEVETQRLLTEAKIAADSLINRSRLQSEKGLGEEQISKERYLKELEIAKERILRVAEIERQKSVDLADIVRQIELSEKTREHVNMQAEVDRIRAVAAEAEEKVTTVRQLEIAERQKAVDLLEARKLIERESISIISSAEAKMKAASSQAETMTIIAGGEAEKIRAISTAEAEAQLIRLKSEERRFKVESDGKRSMHEAENVLDAEKTAARIKHAIIENMPSIIRESVKPMESIEGIRIMQVEGLTGRSAGGGDVEVSSGGGNLADQLVNSALRYRGQAPLVDSVLKEIGLTGGDLNGITEALREKNVEDADPAND